jgi:peroxiredoxin
MPYPTYPEGFYRALHTISQLDRPIYVTENGIADADDDQRALFIRRYLYAMHRAIHDSLDIRGYFYWTLMDNFEWSEGYQMKFGLYEVDFTTQERTLREGSKTFRDMVKKPGVDERGYIVAVGDIVPDLELEYTTGEKITLSDLRGQVVVLQFTASWCSVCRQEMPHLEKDVWQRYKDEGLVLIGIDRDEPLDVVQKFIKEIGVTYPLALDPGADHFAKFAPKKAGVTRNIVIDKSGRIAFLTRLFDEAEFQEMIAVIETLL